MKFILAGMMIGLIAAMLPLTVSGTGSSIIPAWHADKSSISMTKLSVFDVPDVRYVALNIDGFPMILDGNGSLIESYPSDDSTLYSFSEDGKFYCTYSKTGTEVSYYNTDGTRFWAINTPQYPLISPHGSIVILQVADMGTLYLLDKNGKQIENGVLTGKFCTSIDFSENEWIIAGFTSSDYYIADNKGAIRYEGETTEKTMVKTAVLSSTAQFAAVHYGDEEHDGLQVIEISTGNIRNIELSNRHITRTALLVQDDGTCYILNGDEIAVVPSNKKTIETRIKVDMQRPGLATIAESGPYIFAGYVRQDGVPTLKILSAVKKPLIIAELDFPEEKALKCSSAGRLMIAEGTRNLYTWYVK